MEIKTDNPTVAKMILAANLVDKIVAFYKVHPQRYTEEDAIKEAETINKIWDKLP
ncbi:hypothetical protein ES707_11729 [subsurface metagenome]